MRVVCVKSYRNCRHRLFSIMSPEESCDAADKTSPRRKIKRCSSSWQIQDQNCKSETQVFWLLGVVQLCLRVKPGIGGFWSGELHYLWRTEKKTPTFKMDLFLKPSGCRCLLNVSHKKKKLFYINTLQRSDVNPSNIHSFGSTVAPDMNLKVLNSFSALEFDPRPAGQSFYCEMLEVCLKRDSQNEGTTKKLNTHVQERNKMSLTSSRVLERSSFPEAVLVKTCEQLNRSRTTRLSMKDLKCSEILYCSLKTRVPEGSADSVRCTAVILSSSSTLGHTQVLTLFLRCEAVFVAVAAAVPEARAFVLFGVIEPDHGVVLAAALVLLEEAGVWKETGHTEHRFILTVTQLLMISSWLKERLTVSNQPRHNNTSLKVQ